MAQPKKIEDAYNGHLITATTTMVSVATSGGKEVYRRDLPNNQTACAATNFQCGKVFVDGISKEVSNER